MKKIIIFYSRADENYFGGSYRTITVGNTEKAARMLAEITGGDLFKLEQKIPYDKDYDTCTAQAKKDLQAKARPELISLPKAPLKGGADDGNPELSMMPVQYIQFVHLSTSYPHLCLPFNQIFHCTA